MSRTINKTYIYYNHCCDSCKPITVDVYLLTKHIYFLYLLPHGSLSHYKYFTSFLIFFLIAALTLPSQTFFFFFLLCAESAPFFRFPFLHIDTEVQPHGSNSRYNDASQ